jgi:hypothetical protein
MIYTSSMSRAASLSLCLACLPLLPTLAAAANQVSLTPALQKVTFRTPADLALGIAFDDTTIGGGIVIELDPGLAFVSFDFDAGAPDDPAFRLVCPDPSDSRCDDFSEPGVLVAFGSVTGISGTHQMGTLRVLATSAGSPSATPREDDAQGVAGPFQPLPPGSFDTPTFSGATVEVSVPVPSLAPGPGLALAGLLLATGLAARARGRRSPRAA